MVDVRTTTKAVTLPDETWAMLNAFAIACNSPRDNALARAIRECIEARVARSPDTFAPNYRAALDRAITNAETSHAE